MLEFVAIDSHNQVVNFTLEDCPVFLNERQVILAKTEGSNLIHAHTIVRRDITERVMEGDKVFRDNQFAGIIIYNRGFCLQKSDGTLEKFKRSRHISVRVGNYSSMQEAVQSSNRQPIMFRYKERTFSMKALLCYNNGFVVVHTSNDHYKKVLASDINLMTGVGKYCFGDLTDEGGRIVLNHLQPCVMLNNKITEISEVN